LGEAFCRRSIAGRFDGLQILLLEALGSPDRVLRADSGRPLYNSGYATDGDTRSVRRDCYSEPEDVYATAKAREYGSRHDHRHDRMTDASSSDRNPDAERLFSWFLFFFCFGSRRDECEFPDIGMRVHIARYEVDERIHRVTFSRCAGNVFEAAEYLA